MKIHLGWTAFSVIGLFALMLTGPAAAQGTGNNLVVNGGFESGNTGFTTGYAFGNVAPPGTYTIGTNPLSAPGAYPDWCNCADHTAGTGNMMIVNGANSASMPVWEQVVPVTPNTDYTFSYWAAEVDHVSQSVPVLSLRINGTVIGSNMLPTVSPDNGGTWMNYKLTWNSGSSQSADLALFDQNTTTGWNDFALDDICFSTMGCGTAPVVSENDQFVWEGQTYGWYDDGWSGPGCYVVGFAFRRGLGYGGGDGWHGCHPGGRHPHGSTCGGPGQPLCGPTTLCGGPGQAACPYPTSNCGGPGQPLCPPACTTPGSSCAIVLQQNRHPVYVGGHRGGYRGGHTIVRHGGGPHSTSHPTFHARGRVGGGAAHPASHPTFHGGGGGGHRRSDIRLKHDIVLLGHLDNGLGFYRFSYNGSDKVYVGVMAQEVQTVMPAAVARGSDGYLLVDYDRLGIRMQTWNAWVAAGERIPTATSIRH